MKYIVHNKLVIEVPNKLYKELMKLKAEFELAEVENEGYAPDEYFMFDQYFNWLLQATKTVSGLNDNFDLHRYDQISKSFDQNSNPNEDDLPF